MAHALSRPSAPEPSATARVHSLAAVDAELANLWNQMGAGSPAGGVPVRARMSNLIVYAAGEAELAEAERDAISIVQRHPSRVLLLGGGVAPARGELEAEVSAYCHLTGSGTKLCSEAIVIRAVDAARDRLAAAARSLLVGDLPTALWWTPTQQAPPQFGEIVRDLSTLADHVIYDSRGWLDPVGGVIATADWADRAGERLAIADLAWRRLKPWRRLIAQALDPELAPGALASIHEVEVEHGPHALPKAWLLIGWLACRLGWEAEAGQVQPGVEVTWGFRSPSGPVGVTVRRRSEGDPEVYRVTIRWGEPGDAREATFELLDGGRVGVVEAAGKEPSRILAAPGRERAALVARQLANRGGDALFRRTVGISRTMARALLR